MIFHFAGISKLLKADLALPPARRFAVLTCMDARLDPAKFLGLQEGDTHVIRNAGGRGITVLRCYKHVQRVMMLSDLLLSLISCLEPENSS